MNKSFENRYGMPYTNQNCKESAWDKMRKGVRCYSGWGKTKEEENSSRFVNRFPGIDDDLDALERLIDDYERECATSSIHPPKSARFPSYYLSLQIKDRNGAMESDQRNRFHRLIDRASSLKMH